MNLDQFITQVLEHGVRNAYVEEPGFDTLYVRVAIRFFDGQQMRTIDLATIGASNPGGGAFTKLVARLREKYPTMTIFVESVQTEWFRNKLRAMGFVERDLEPYNFYLLPRKME
ncbi:hypothetical protein M0R72_00900 [Candidatus Pacearchaeota archaeon]|nr:hypothetical protein [Candidatus Pacearchaeota archaeon]